jgi:hypothetical protein
MVTVRFKFLHKRGEPMFLNCRDGSAAAVQAVVGGLRMWKGQKLTYTETVTQREGIIEDAQSKILGTWEVAQR